MISHYFSYIFSTYWHWSQKQPEMFLKKAEFHENAESLYAWDLMCMRLCGLSITGEEENTSLTIYIAVRKKNVQKLQTTFYYVDCAKFFKIVFISINKNCPQDIFLYILFSSLFCFFTKICVYKFSLYLLKTNKFNFSF